LASRKPLPDTLKNIAKYLDINYTIISRVIKKIEEKYEKLYCKA